MLTIFRKIFIILIFLLVSIYSQADENKSFKCNGANEGNNSLFQDKELKFIEIKVNNYRGWQVNNIRILTNNSHVIPEKFKKRYKASIKFYFSDDTFCTSKAKIRTHGDLKDHIIYNDGKVEQSLDISLNEGHIHNITKFKLFLKGTRGIEEDEIFMTQILREFGFLAPRSKIVEVKFNDQKIKMLFQEKVTKELLEFNNRREGPILEGDEKYMMNYISKVKNNPSIDWNEILRLADLSSKIQLSKQTNSSWSIKNRLFTDISFDAIKKLNLIYLVYLNNYNDENNNYSFINYNLDNNLLAQNDNDKKNKLNIYNNLIIAGNGEHSLYAHNRKFYWNAIENYFEPIYYDGEFNLSKKVEKLNYPLSIDYSNSIDETLKLINKLDKKKFLKKINNKNQHFTEKQIEQKINSLEDNLNTIKLLYNEKNEEDLAYNLNIYKEKNLIKNYIHNLEKQRVQINFVKYNYDKNVNSTFLQVCDNKFENCNKNLLLNQIKTRDLLEGKLKIEEVDYQFIDNNSNNFNNYEKFNFRNDYFDNVKLFYNSGIKYDYIENDKTLKIHQINQNGRAYFLDGNIKDVTIEFYGNQNYLINNHIQLYDHKTLTGCLSFVNNKFINTNLKVINSNCEDGINVINSNGIINNINANFAAFDGIDFDFSNLSVKNIKINNSGNDCIDFSNGKYNIEYFYLNNCGDKAISVGEKTIAKFKHVEIDLAQIGIASKDSSEVYVQNSKIQNTVDCLSAYNKKQEYDGGFLKINKSFCSKYKRYKYIDNFSKIDLLNEL